MTSNSSFALVCLAYVASLFGRLLTGFGLGVWLYQSTGSATTYGWMAVATMAPGLAAALLAGAIVDRWSPRWAMLIGHLGAGVCSIVLVLLVGFGGLSVLPILGLVALASLFHALQMPALSASTALLVRPDRLAKANGAAQFGTALAQVLAPTAAGLFITAYGLWPLLVIDIFALAFAFVVIIKVRFPSNSNEEQPAKRALFEGVLDGWHYLRARKGFLVLVGILAIVNFNLGALDVLVTPLVLGFADARVLGIVKSIGGVGMVAGGSLLMAWSPRRQVQGIVVFALAECALLLLGGARPSAALVAGGAFGVLFLFPLIGGCAQVFWQRKVPMDLQGRVYAVRLLVAQSAIVVAYMVAGPLVDRVFTPLMSQGGALAITAGQLLGVGPGRGVALLLVSLGVLSFTGVMLLGLSPSLRRLEDELPDRDSSAAAFTVGSQN